MYKRTKWLDRVVDVDTEELIQEGTDQSAGNFNNMEFGISDNQITASMLLTAANRLITSKTEEILVVQLTNTEHFPFNNSQVTMGIVNLRATTNYTVETEIVAHEGDVGDVYISDKLVNGFKVRYDGSAKSAMIQMTVRGGM